MKIGAFFILIMVFVSCSNSSEDRENQLKDLELNEFVDEYQMNHLVDQFLQFIKDRKWWIIVKDYNLGDKTQDKSLAFNEDKWDKISWEIFLPVYKLHQAKLESVDMIENPKDYLLYDPNSFHLGGYYNNKPIIYFMVTKSGDQKFPFKFTAPLSYRTGDFFNIIKRNAKRKLFVLNIGSGLHYGFIEDDKLNVLSYQYVNNINTLETKKMAQHEIIEFFKSEKKFIESDRGETRIR